MFKAQGGGCHKWRRFFNPGGRIGHRAGGGQYLRVRAADGGDADAGWRRDGGRFDDGAGNAGPEALAPAEGRGSFRVVWPAAGRLAGAGRRT